MKTFGNCVSAAGGFVILAVVGTVVSTRHVHAQHEDQQQDESASRVQRGLEIAPVPLNLQGRREITKGKATFFSSPPGTWDNTSPEAESVVERGSAASSNTTATPHI